ncbi:VOC family protein [Pseudonocardia petroleophila]|uniref:VOC family protein n=1 Tax=Pseudonocardia petroleophila TaxID=37331 RepID=A0A7G7MJA1_9PSEU|nr:VOC family protein [Pseudonocardia petroleophila]QNG52862.1 VOC family protein [Pseudonocardia petroleophila]
MEILSSRVILRPADPGRTVAFYRDVLGLAIAREFPGGTVFFAGNGFVEVSGGSDGGTRDGVALWLQVRDVDAAHRDLAAHVVREPRDEPWGLREMWIADPDGTRIVLVQIPPDHPIRRDVRS